jgi:hypothetical protein
MPLDITSRTKNMSPGLNTVLRTKQVLNILKTIATLTTSLRTSNDTNIVVAFPMMTTLEPLNKRAIANVLDIRVELKMTRVTRNRQTTSVAFFSMEPIALTSLVIKTSSMLASFNSRHY